MIKQACNKLILKVSKPVKMTFEILFSVFFYIFGRFVFLVWENVVKAYLFLE